MALRAKRYQRAMHQYIKDCKGYAMTSLPDFAYNMFDAARSGLEPCINEHIHIDNVCSRCVWLKMQCFVYLIKQSEGGSRR